MRGALVLLVLCAAAPARAESLQRFALIAGNDSGGDETRALLYARDDARKIHSILLRLGGVQPQDASLLLNASADQLLTALSDLERRSDQARREGKRTALLFYYSGHAKDGALLMGRTRIPLQSLKDRLAQAPSDVRIGVFDSCRSGVLTRTKGVRKTPAFDVETDTSRLASGLVILTSSASDEDSQESDLIGGSYFSHHLASGLVGDADRSGDGRITLSEAYAYAYERTVADTAESAAGAQHPTFQYDLAGNGDVVLTDVSSRREGVLLTAASPAGSYFLVDARGFVAAELVKSDGVERRVGLPPGTYRVKRRLPDKLRIGEVTVAAGQVAVLEEARLKDAAFSDDPVKGTVRARLLSPRTSLALSGTYQSFFDGATRDQLFPPAPLFGFELRLHNYFRRDWVWAFDLAAGSTRSVLQLSTFSAPYRFTQLSVGTSLWVEWLEGPVVPFVGARLALLVMGRDFTDTTLPSQGMSTISPGLVAGVRVRLGPHFGLTLRGRTHYVLYNIDEDRSLGYWELGTLLDYEL